MRPAAVRGDVPKRARRAKANEGGSNHMTQGSSKVQWGVVAIGAAVALACVGIVSTMIGANTAQPRHVPQADEQRQSAQQIPPAVAPTMTPTNAAPAGEAGAASEDSERAIWDEFRRTGTVSMRDDPRPEAHRPIWCFRVFEPAHLGDELVSCHPTPARCDEVRAGEVSGRDDGATVSRCEERRTLWCAPVAVGRDWMCRSSERICALHLREMEVTDRRYLAVTRCEERWAR